MTEDNDSDRVEELLQEERDIRRVETEPRAEQPAPQVPSRQEAIRSGYDALENGELQNVLSTRDDHLAAILYGLDARGELSSVVAAAAELRGVDLDEGDVHRSTALAHLAKAGLTAIDESLLETALEAHREFRAGQVDRI